jgi:hypothetical protein
MVGRREADIQVGGMRLKEAADRVFRKRPKDGTNWRENALLCRMREGIAMSLTIELDPTLEARLRHAAAKQGVDAATYIAAALKGLLLDNPDKSIVASPNELELLEQINLGISPKRGRGITSL